MQISYLCVYCIVIIIIRHRRAMRKVMCFFFIVIIFFYSSHIDLHPNFVHILWHLRKGFVVTTKRQRQKDHVAHIHARLALA